MVFSLAFRVSADWRPLGTGSGVLLSAPIDRVRPSWGFLGKTGIFMGGFEARTLFLFRAAERQRTISSTQGDSVRWARPRPPTGIAMPSKRGCEDAEDETAQELRRTKSATNEAMNEFLCPITFLLFSGDKVDAWKLKLKEDEEVAEMRRKAEAGQGWAMCNLGVWYKHGQKGLAKDFAKAFEWYKKSHEAGDAVGTGGLGRCYLLGNGEVTKCPMRANTLMCQAAERGSKLTCYHLGRSYAEGLWGFPKDETMARRYYSMVASALIEDCTAGAKEGAATWLREHPTT